MIKYILFDLDNTLYSSHYGLERQTALRIKQYIAKYLGTGVEEAAAERKKRIADYGTTIEWLIAEKGFTDIEDYYSVIHPENEADTLPANPALKEFLENLPCKRAIMTNAPIEHARRILSRLGVEACFTEIFDMRHMNFKGKPRKDAFFMVLSVLKAAPEQVLFVDDMPGYVEGYLAIGGKGVLFDEDNMHPGYTHEKIRNLKEITGFLDMNSEG
ncbi:MAG: HAD-IA family hydrolase, partial [Treponema sp.]|nr:HAD-IA family hydrolase [Treponema sp.]